MTIGKVEIIDHRTLDVEFFGYHHYIAPHLAKDFAELILAKAEEARQTGPRCRCGHLVEDHGFFNGDSHPDPDNSNGVCGCVFSQNEAMLHAAGLDSDEVGKRMKEAAEEALARVAEHNNFLSNPPQP
jgi:hypothetical protein